MNAHDPDMNPTVDQIESAAADAASFWLDHADRAAIDAAVDPRQRQRAVAGCTIAAGLFFHACRQVDAAEIVADAPRDVASAIREHQQATEGGAP